MREIYIFFKFYSKINSWEICKSLSIKLLKKQSVIKTWSLKQQKKISECIEILISLCVFFYTRARARRATNWHGDNCICDRVCTRECRLDRVSAIIRDTKRYTEDTRQVAFQPTHFRNAITDVLPRSPRGVFAFAICRRILLRVHDGAKTRCNYTSFVCVIENLWSEIYIGTCVFSLARIWYR